MSNNFYDTLWIDKTADAAEIKKAYRKKAMKYHPDKNKGDVGAEKQFKKVNEAYQTLSDSEKKKQYDMFGSTKWNPFSWAGATSGWAGGFWGFEDMFWAGGWRGQKQDVEFDFGDLFWNMWGQQRWWNPFWWGQQSRRPQEKKKPESLDFEKTYEVPIFDMILGCKIEVKWVYGQTAKLKIPAGTKSGSKFRVKEFWKSEGTKKWNLIVKVEALMPKNISDVDKQMLERIRENVGY